jgi:two-component system, response regulator
MIHMAPVILLVEDNPDDVELTRIAFERSNVANQLVVASDGREALDYLFSEGAHTGRNPPRMPNVILLDLNLPKISGLEVLRRMQADERTKRIPVVVLTTSNEERDILASYELGANSYVRKPVDFVQFLDAARQLGSYWLMLNEPSPTGGGNG